MDNANSEMTLQKRIEQWSADHAADFPPEVQQIFKAKTEEIIKSGILQRSLQKGSEAPDFELKTTNGKTTSLSETLKEGCAILNFYRGTWCPYCDLQFNDLLEKATQFQAKRAAILAISPQVNDRRDLPEIAGFYDLSDPGNQVAKDYGLVVELGKEIQRIYQGFGIFLDQYNGDNSWEVPIPAAYVIDPDQIVQYAYTNADFSRKAEPQILLEAVTNLQS